MKQSQRIFEPLETIVIENNEREHILASYTELVNLAEHNHSLSPKTIEHVATLKISHGLSKNMCYKLWDSGYSDTFIINAVSTDIRLIEFNDSQVADTIATIDFSDMSDPMISEGLLSNIRSHLLGNAQDCINKFYKNLFMSPYSLISEKELNQIQKMDLAIQLLDVEQISTEHCDYIAAYLSRQNADINQTYKILSFVCRIEDTSAKRKVFFALDFERLCYFRMGKDRKAEIVEKLSDCIDFDDIQELLDFMQHTRCSYEPFELQISMAIKDNTFEPYNASYAEYVKIVKKINHLLISNLCALSSTYSMPPHILNEIYGAKKYLYYVISKTLAEKHFEMELEKLEVLFPVYMQVFLSEEKLYPKTKSLMAKNSDFISYMAEQKVYEGTPEHTRLMFSNCMQSKELLFDLFKNYEDSFIIQYLSQNHGFKNRDAALYFIGIIKKKDAVAKSDQVYEQNYDKLVDGTLKSIFTRLHNIAKKS